MSYASLGISEGDLRPFTLWSIDGEATPVDGFNLLNPGGLAMFHSSSPLGAGGSGFIFGEISVKGNDGAVIASGMFQVVQDSLGASGAPNSITNSHFLIHRGQAF